MQGRTGVVSWHVALTVRPGALAEFAELTAEMIAVSRREPGMLVYERHISPDEGTVHVYERWADSATAAAHLRAFQARFSRRFGALVERQRFVVYGTPSEELGELLRGFGAEAFLVPFGKPAE